MYMEPANLCLCRNALELPPILSSCSSAASSAGSLGANTRLTRWFEPPARFSATLPCQKAYGSQLRSRSNQLSRKSRSLPSSVTRWHKFTVCNSRDASSWESDRAEYVRAHVLDAVSMVPLDGQLFMTLGNGREVEVDHINPAKGRLLYRSPNPTIFLKVVHDSDLMLPIVVGEFAMSMLITALHGKEKPVRPDFYQLLLDVISATGYEVQMVRITKRVLDTYHARIYFGKHGEGLLPSVDARPSDAINLAVRCKVPIYVNKDIISTDAVRPVYTLAQGARRFSDHSGGGTSKSAFLDSPNGEHDLVAEEIALMSNMISAIVEERYKDAARCWDELTKLRTAPKTQEHQD